MKTALLLSGGMDSIAVAWWKRPDVAFTVDYGQLAAPAEVSASRSVCERLRIPHHILRFDARELGSGDMAGAAPDANAPASDWWPYRNQFLLTLVGMKAISIGMQRLLIGTVASDGSHQDGTPEFVLQISHLMQIQEGGLVVEAPAIDFATIDLIRMSAIPHDVLAWAHSCHKAHVPCGNCRGCNKYLQVWQELNIHVDVAG
ncbi:MULTISPECIES: 7-cyano-7-deazaguanine synthase [Xanthomonas]|uniref:7-cyano-7-deazaguanine synthase n=1 Tax=Xanthomonas TaxID=338 RepID=UPI000F8DC240|nr:MULTISPECIES: 7-cyano-7-deazaguanine synthase [Xanthomonas]NJB79063.1 7-cyano-7-deazaguanine synthase [Xanthomonas arboricola]